MRSLSTAMLLATLFLLTACGGGGGDSGNCVPSSAQECTKQG